jgi:hypothetical protein
MLPSLVTKVTNVLMVTFPTMVTCLQVSQHAALGISTLLYDSGSWTLQEQDKYGITASEIKFVRKTAKLTLFGLKINQDILREKNLKHNQH